MSIWHPGEQSQTWPHDDRPRREIGRKRAESKEITVEEELANTAQTIPLGRLAKPEGQAAMAACLATELASYIIGVSQSWWTVAQ